MSVPYIGDYSVGSTVYFVFNTFTSDDPSASCTITNLINTDLHIHKNNDTTQRNNAAGVTVSVDFDSITGNHLIAIDTSDNTVADFWVGGADYFVRMEGTTIDAATVNAFIAHFSLENRRVAGELISTTIASLTSQTEFTLTAGSADNDAYNNCIAIVSDQVSAVQKCIGRISDYTGASKTVILAADPAIFTMAAKDNITIIATSALSNVSSVGGTAQTANDNGADINAILVDTAEIGAAGAGLSAVPWNAAWDAEVESEVTDSLVAHNLDHLCLTATAGADMTTEVADNTIISRLLASGDTSTFDPTTDSLQDIRDKLTDIETDTGEIGAAGAGLTAVAVGVGGIASTSFAANALDAAATAADFITEINNQVVDGLATDTYAEPGQGDPAATASLSSKIGYLYKAWRNKVIQDATTYELYNDAGDTVDQKATISDDGTDFTKGEIGTGP